MAPKTYVAVSCILVCSVITLCAGENEFYITNGIVPDLLSVSPPAIATVLYKGGVSVNLCNQIDPRKLDKPPLISWEYKEGVLYTLLMLDLDVPSRDFPVARSMLHMLAMNVTANTVYSASDMVFDYVGPNPFFATGVHRYVFLVYEQTANTTSVAFNERVPFFGRIRFSLTDFVRNHNLIGPVAGNCFLAEFSGF